MARDEWGDFQTPIELANQVVELMSSREWSRVLEPTCGTGTFLTASKLLGPDIERRGIEIRPAYVERARSAGFEVTRADIFATDLAQDLPWKCDGPLLIIGNPPWVTNAQLGAMGSANLPKKLNLKGLSGFDAITGASNFDLAEYILLKIMGELRLERPTLAFLVKTHVARNVIAHASKFKLPYCDYEIRLIDSKKWFGASVDACLFVARYNEQPVYECDVFNSIASEKSVRTMATAGDRLVADIAKYRLASPIDGISPLEWRSGVKHDAAGIMELDFEACQTLQLEAERVYPLLKCSDIYRDRLRPNKCVLLPQTRLGEDTVALRDTAPNLWNYLMIHSEMLDKRKSSVYRTQPRFAVFGIGDYTFAPYKIAISGLHKAAHFVLLGPHNGKPILVDDASYIVGFSDAQEAALCYAMLKNRLAQALLQSLVFWDSKRPITKKLLQRINLRAIAQYCEIEELTNDADDALESVGEERSRSWDMVLESLQQRWTQTQDAAQLKMAI